MAQDDQWAVVAQTPAPAAKPAAASVASTPPAAAAPAAAAAADPWSVVRTEPVQPPAPPPDQPSWRDRVISYLTAPNPRFTPQPGANPVSEAARISGNLAAGQFTGRTELDIGRRALGSIAPLILHPLTSATAMLDQIGSAALAAPTSGLTHEQLEKFRGHGAVTDRVVDLIEQGRANTKETLTAMLDQAKRDPVGFLEEQAGQALAAHGVGEAAGALKDTVTSRVAEHVTAAKKAVLGLSPAEVKEGIVDPKVAENANQLQEAHEQNQAAAAKHADDVAAVQQENAEKEARIAAANAKRLAAHMEAVDQVHAENEAAEKAAAEKTAALQEQATAAHEEATAAAADAEQTETRRGQLARDEISTRQAIMDRVRQIAAATKSRVSGLFDTVRDRVNNIAEKDKVAQADHGASYWELSDEDRAAVDKKVPAPTTLLAPLVEAVAKAEGLFKGSKEKISVFRDIINRAKTDGATDDLREQIAQGTFKGSYDTLDLTKKAAVDKAATDYQNRYFETRGEEPPAEQQIDFDHLRGYSSELGRAIDDNIRGGGDGDVRQALFAVKAQVDAMAQHLADTAKAGGKLKTAKAYWRIYKSVFEEPTGHAGGGRATGSPVAQAVEAGKAFPSGDAFHATEPFLVKDAEGASRARQLLVGRKFTDPYFDPNAGRLLDKLRAIKREQAGLPKPEKTAAAIEAKPATTEPPTVSAVEPKIKPEPKPKEPLEFTPKKEPVAKPPAPIEPDLNDLSPEQLQHLKQANLLDKFREFRKLSTYRVSRMINGGLSILGGLVAIGGSVTGMAAGAKLGLELGGGAALAGGLGAFAWSLGPRIFANLLDSPKTIRFLTAPTADELEYVRTKLPPSQRTGVEAAIRDLSDKAQAAGKLNAPSPWLTILRDLSASTAATANKQGRAKQAAEDKAAAARQAKEQQDWLADPANDPNRPEFYQQGGQQQQQQGVQP